MNESAEIGKDNVILAYRLVSSEISPLVSLFFMIYPLMNTCFFYFVHFLIGVYFMRAIWVTIPKRNLGILGGLMSFSLIYVCYLSVKYPEGQLIFETHLYRAKSVYDAIDETKREQLESSLSFRLIADYLEQIPPEFFDSGSLKSN